MHGLGECGNEKDWEQTAANTEEEESAEISPETINEALGEETAAAISLLASDFRAVVEKEKERVAAFGTCERDLTLEVFIAKRLYIIAAASGAAEAPKDGETHHERKSRIKKRKRVVMQAGDTVR